MPATNAFYAWRGLLALLLVPALGWAKDSVQTYSVPKEKAAVVSKPATPLTWTAPKDWETKGGSPVRLVQFGIPGPNGSKADMAVMVFPGDVGGEVANVNRWRAEVGLGQVTEKEITSQKVPVGSESGKLYEFVGDSQSTLVAWVMKDGASYFFKMRGDKAAVAAAKPAMLDFLKSVKFQAAPSLNANAAIGDPSSGNPHANMPENFGMPAGHPPMDAKGMPAGHPAVGDKAAEMPAGHPDVSAKAAAASGKAPVLQAPAHWKEQPAPNMVVKSYSVSDEKAGKATVSISTFPGQVGGTLANVNRWRGQIGLKPITEAEIPTTTKTLDVQGAKATLMDATGTDAASGKPVRLAALMVPGKDSVWFYKLLGDGPEVERETPNLVKVAQTARFP